MNTFFPFFLFYTWRTYYTFKNQNTYCLSYFKTHSAWFSLLNERGLLINSVIFYPLFLIIPRKNLQLLKIHFAHTLVYQSWKTIKRNRFFTGFSTHISTKGAISNIWHCCILCKKNVQLSLILKPQWIDVLPKFLLWCNNSFNVYERDYYFTRKVTAILHHADQSTRWRFRR